MVLGPKNLKTEVLRALRLVQLQLHPSTATWYDWSRIHPLTAHSSGARKRGPEPGPKGSLNLKFPKHCQKEPYTLNSSKKISKLCILPAGLDVPCERFGCELLLGWGSPQLPGHSDAVAYFACIVSARMSKIRQR